MAGIERGIGDVFGAFEIWLVSTGATGSVMRLAWALLSILWLGHVAVSTRPGREPDLVGAFARLALSGGLLSGIGGLTHAILLGFETFRSAGAAVLDGLVGQAWSQFVQDTIVPQIVHLFMTAGPYFAYPWAIVVLVTGVALGVALFAVGTMVYLAILFFAHLTLLLAIFLAPLAVALLAAPATQRWAATWAAVVVRTALMVFAVRVVHAATLYLAVIVPFRDVTSALPGGPTDSPAAAGPAALASLLWRLAGFLFIMLVGTGIGVYTMLRVERLVTQFVAGPSFGENALVAPLRLRGPATASLARAARRVPDVNVVPGAGVSIEAIAAGGSGSTGAQDATVLRGGLRTWT